MKKWLLVGVILMITLSVVLLGCSGGKTEVGKSIGVIQVPGGSKIKVVYAEDFPKEIEVNWEKIGMADAFQLGLEGAVRNVSNQTVSFRIAFILDGDQIGVWPAPFRGAVIRPITKVDSPINHEIIHMAQAVIDTRALNICGIFSLPVNTVVKTYT